MIDLKTIVAENCEKVEGPMADLFLRKSELDSRKRKQGS